VRYYGCPAEEAAAGKTFMVNAGAFDGVDAAVSWHPAAVTGVARMLTLSYSQVYFRFRGVAAHAGASPHLGRSALDAVELMNVGVNFLREHMPSDDRVHYAITDAGGLSPNVVQAGATVYYIVRSPTVQGMRELLARVTKIAHGAALMTETEVAIEFDGACAELLPNDALEAAMQAHLDDLGGVPFDADDFAAAGPFVDTLAASEVEFNRRLAGLEASDRRSLHAGIAPLNAGTKRPQMTASTDVGDVSWIVPTVQCTTAVAAIGTAPHSWQLVAQGKLPAAHKGMVHAAKTMALTALEMAQSGDLLDRARAEFAERTAAHPYDRPIPADVLPPPLRPAAAT
jgi:aminobenzoyl-glutamate utilization protein B